MKITYDLHIHSALSPCADDQMTPANIVGWAKLGEIDAVAIADHNAIANVKVAMNIGDAYGVVVVPAMELQTAEDIHVLCLFDSFENLQSFYNCIDFADIQNRAEIFGEQWIMDEDDNVVATEPRMLLMASGISVEDVTSLANKFDGIAIPAHIDREENGMVAILGTVTDDFSVVELSPTATDDIHHHCANRNIITDSDAHVLEDIGKAHGSLDVDELSAKGILKALRSKL